MTTTIDIVLFDGVDELDAVGPLEVLRGVAAQGADLETAGVRFVDQRVVDAGGLVTAGGVTSGLDLALHLVERLVSPEAAERQAAALEYPWRPSPKTATAGGHPAPSGHTITTEPVDGLVTARWGGEVIAESGDALLLRETGLAPVTYFPIDDVRMDLLHRTEHHTRCPFKGEASYWSVEVGDRRSEDIAWAYEDPLPARAELKGRLAFYADRLEGLEVRTS